MKILLHLNNLDSPILDSQNSDGKHKFSKTKSYVFMTSDNVKTDNNNNNNNTSVEFKICNKLIKLYFEGLMLILCF